MRYVTITCPQCKRSAQLSNGHVNRARKLGVPIYCGRACAGLARRKNKSDAQKKAEKRDYDMEYRRKNLEMLKRKKAEHYLKTRDPEKEAAYRKTRMHLHVEYCRQPKYKAWKKKYDAQYRAKKLYGEFWESFLLIMGIEAEVTKRMSNYEIRLENGTINKAQQRRRDYERINRQQSENCFMGNA